MLAHKISIVLVKICKVLILLILSEIFVGAHASSGDDCSRFFSNPDGKWPSEMLRARGLVPPTELLHVEGYLLQALESPVAVTGIPLSFVDRMFSRLQFQVNPAGEDYSITVVKTFRQDQFVDAAYMQKIYQQTKISWTELMRLRLQGKMGELHVARLMESRDAAFQLVSEYVPGVRLFDLIREETATGYVINRRAIGKAEMELLERMDQALRQLLPSLQMQFAAVDGTYVEPEEETILGRDLLTAIRVMNDDDDYLLDISLQHTVYDPVRDRLVVISPL